MGKNRLEAFSDGVLAIIITIMVLELKVPHGTSLEELTHLGPRFLSYVVSFVYLGIYWNNHHHLLHTVRRVKGSVLWANLHLLFWLSLIPFVTEWAGETRYESLPTALYGLVLFLAGTAYFILARTIIAVEGPDSLLLTAIGRDWKGLASSVIYLVAVAVAFFVPRVAVALYVVVAGLWLIPDRRIERALEAQEEG